VSLSSLVCSASRKSGERAFAFRIAAERSRGFFLTVAKKGNEMYFKAVACFFIAAFILAGCASIKNGDLEPIAIEKQRIVIDAPRVRWINDLTHKLESNGFDVYHSNLNQHGNYAASRAKGADYLVAIQIIGLDLLSKLPVPDKAMTVFGGSDRGHFISIEVDIVDLSTSKVVKNFFESGTSGHLQDLIYHDLTRKISTTLISLPLGSPVVVADRHLSTDQ
jgi:hypothetical protein